MKEYPVSPDDLLQTTVEKSQWEWDIELQGDDRSAFPQEPCNNVGVRFRLDGGSAMTPSQDDAHVETASKFLFRNFTYPYGYCSCSAKASSVFQETAWVHNDNHWDPI